jgi:cyanophycinase
MTRVTLQPKNRPGYLMPIGGAEDKKRARVVLSRFVELSGGADARIVVIPGASTFPFETGAAYCTLFHHLGARSVEALHITHRGQANDPLKSALIDGATGIFMTGGDQLRLLTVLGGTIMADHLRTAYEMGATIAGTSAGASAMSEHMIAFGRSGAMPSQRMVQMGRGLGLTEDLIIDQHFSQRDRLGRLTTAVALNPGLIGVGVDEDTALIIDADGMCEVVGSGIVTVVDGRQLEYTDIATAKRYDVVTVSGIDAQQYRAGEFYTVNMPDFAAEKQAI